MDNKKIILPSNNEVAKYGKKQHKIEGLPNNPLDNFLVKEVNNKHKQKFCSTIKVFLNWKELVRNILNNTDYKHDKR